MSDVANFQAYVDGKVSTADYASQAIQDARERTWAIQAAKLIQAAQAFVANRQAPLSPYALEKLLGEIRGAQNEAWKCL